jgi:hypothetical protein
MKSFLKMTLAVIVGLILTGILSFVIMLSVISGIAAAGNKPAEIAEKSVLVLRLPQQYLTALTVIPSPCWTPFH